MSTRILIHVGGAHAQAIADETLQLADARQPLSVAGFLDDDPALHGTRYQGIAMLGPIEAAPSIPHDGMIVGVGSSQARLRIYATIETAGLPFVTVRHPSAVLSLDVVVGPGCYIGANVLLNGTGCLGHHNEIGDHVHSGPGVSTASPRAPMPSSAPVRSSRVTCPTASPSWVRHFVVLALGSTIDGLGLAVRLV